MKLFAKYTRIIITVTLAILMVSSLAFFFTLKYVQLHQIDGDLEIEEKEVQLYVEEYHHLPKIMSVENQLIQFTPVSTPFKERYFQKAELNVGKTEREDFRQLIFGTISEGKWYKVTVSKSLEETDHLIRATLIITAITIFGILISLLVINRIVLKKLWKPFYRALDVVKRFKVSKDETLQFPATNTSEFTTMIDTLKNATHQAKTDYLTLKTFSENASHEIQTPITIIRSKIELLNQSENLTERQSRTLQTISSSIDRLSRLNSSLLLLAKIENKQFDDVEKIELKDKMEEKIISFQELWQMKNIEVYAELEEKEISMNKELSDILLNNLFSNATRHNIENGKIAIQLSNGEFTISNTSTESGLDQDKVFQRFYKPSQTREHNGLGLSIIKQICESSGLAVNYRYMDCLHSFKISWHMI